MSRSLQLAGNRGAGGTGRGGGGVRGAGQGLAALRCGQGRAGQAGGAAHAAEVGLGDQWTWVQTRPPHVLLRHFGQYVTASLSFVFLISNLELRLLGPVSYSSWKSLIRGCSRRSQLHPGTHAAGPRG